LSEFIDMLNAMRYGEIDDDSSLRFRKLARKVLYTDGIEPTELQVGMAKVLLLLSHPPQISNS
jgi:hypothetical protein